ncbi:MAG TPA: indolepyruvate oxidoreductase subunit beta [Candidatus Pullichristensenella stercorigallinarum]|uniref:Indolepyruvate oxidoreductase subunit beta n=1 Tax=Candidatus Pullichristensenella stercorigallinarum TaxID=2840909 RepID=A0A9D0ZLN7_9FIRM|nr:indolepyruvate oxidoreductase subunit beta [Candidatus Pullichristensenella stercorigallinarum]
MNTTSIMIVGVGGQGTLLASKVLGQALVSLDYDVKVSEVHGMSQRGGSVVTYVRYGSEVHSPIVDLGEADYMLAFEPLEAARYLPWLKNTGVIITNTRETMPMPVITGAATYPENIVEKLSQRASVVSLDAMKLALEAGNPKAVNMVLMGVLASRMDLPEETWQAALEKQVPPKFLELNRRAFALGRAQKEA